MPRVDEVVAIVQEIKKREGLSPSDRKAVDDAVTDIRSWVDGSDWICINRLYDILDLRGIRKLCTKYS